MPKTFLLLGAINVLLCVVLGAFGEHGLKTHFGEQMLSIFQTAIQYHFLHAIGLMLVGLGMFHIGHGLLRGAGYLMLVGIVLFSGSLYVLALGGAKWFGVITPLGGVGFLAAWVCFAVGIWRGL